MKKWFQKMHKIQFQKKYIQNVRESIKSLNCAVKAKVVF